MEKIWKTYLGAKLEKRIHLTNSSALITSNLSALKLAKRESARLGYDPGATSHLGVEVNKKGVSYNRIARVIDKINKDIMLTLNFDRLPDSKKKLNGLFSLLQSAGFELTITPTPNLLTVVSKLPRADRDLLEWGEATLPPLYPHPDIQTHFSFGLFFFSIQFLPRDYKL